MSAIKLTWRVAEAPTGPYRSFVRRGWPSAYLVDGRPAFRITCEDDYTPARVREGQHAELTIGVAAWRSREGDSPTFEWRRLKRRAATLDEAKRTCAEFCEAHPGYFEIWKERD